MFRMWKKTEVGLCSFILRVYIRNVIRAKFYFVQLSPVNCGKLGQSRYRRSAQLCLPASVRLFIPGCTCVFVGMWRVAKLHKGVWVCGVQVHFVALCVTASQNTTRTPFTHHSSIPLRCHLSTPEAFPEHTTNKVGQVHGWALFLSESNFQEVPTGKRVPAASDNRTMTRSFPSPLTSAELNHMPQFSKSSAQPLHRTPQTCTSLLSVPELILIT